MSLYSTFFSFQDFKNFQEPYSIHRLNSGIKNRINFFAWAIFLIQKVWTNSVIYADSGDIKILVQFPGNSILRILHNFWKCVVGVYMRGFLVLKITQTVQKDEVGSIWLPL